MFWKTLAFCSFQISHEANNARDATALRFGFWPSVKRSHQLGRERVGHCVREVDGGKSEPSLDKPPHAYSVAAMDDKVCYGLQSSFAEWTKTTIRPTSFLQAVGRSKPILKCKPHKEFDLRGGQLLLQTKRFMSMTDRKSVV